MALLNIRLGSDSFRKIRERQCVYIDKTSIIEEMFRREPSEVSLITRPRRFGKTLMMSMLHEFFDISKDSRQLFEGLAISKNTALCEKWMNKHPTVFLTFKEINGKTYDIAQEQLTECIRDLLIEYSYLLESDKVDPTDRERLVSLKNGTGTWTDLTRSLIVLCRALKAFWGMPVILLIDEYDVPINNAQQRGYYGDMVDLMKNLLSGSLKSSGNSLELAVLTGCLRIARESIFTGLNNFTCYGISHTKYADKFGFTPQEVDALLDEADLSDKKTQIQEWYDGYRFGKGTEIYCPWDVLNYVSDLQIDPLAEPLTYWNNTSGNAIVRTLVEHAGSDTRNKIGELISGLAIEEKLTEDLTYDNVYKKEAHLWSMLYLTGYLTKAVIQHKGENTALVIPNKEIKQIFKETVWTWFEENLDKNALPPLVSALWQGDTDTIQTILKKILVASISYHDNTESFYHGFLTGILLGAGLTVRSNRENGLGRTDIVIEDNADGRAIIIEFKRAEKRNELEKKAEEALLQIEERKYAEGLSDQFDSILKYGMSFCKKDCFAKLG